MRRRWLTILLFLFLVPTLIALGGLAKEPRVLPAIVLSFSLTGASVVTFLLRRAILRERREAEKKEK